MDVRLEARGVARVMAVCIAALTVLHGVVHVLRWQFGWSLGVRYFDTNLEGTVPAFFSALLMLLAAGLLALIAAAEQTAPGFRRASWMLLAVVFLFLPFDELFAVHERLNVPLRRAFHTSGALGFAWVLPYGALALAVGALMVRLLTDLPARTRMLMIAAGVIYLGGALGLEMVGAYVAETAGKQGFAYFIEATVEELLEMAGLAIFIHALLEHLTSLHATVSFGAAGAGLQAGDPDVGSFEARELTGAAASLHVIRPRETIDERADQEEHDVGVAKQA